MKIIIHEEAKNLIKVLSFPAEEVVLVNPGLIHAFFELCERFPEELIGWCNKDLENEIDLEQWEKVFHHDLIMASYAVKTTFFSDCIGYVDQLPFVKVKRKVLYGTWQMSSDIGGIKGKVAGILKPLLNEITNFEFLLNSAAKIGQQNGLFCYSDPGFFKFSKENTLRTTSSVNQLFLFVHLHYNSVWSTVLLWCFFLYEKKFPIFSYLQVFRKRKIFRKEIDFSEIEVSSTNRPEEYTTVDVIIPTIGRPSHLLQVMEDLKRQSLLPERVIVVEQNSNENAVTELSELTNKEWPFEVIHHFINKTGACNARNLALKETTSNFVFFCDDDNRIPVDTIKIAIKEMGRLGCKMISTSYRQPDEKLIFGIVKQWGTFGAGNSIVRSDVLSNVRFSPVFEHGYGEDKDFGMQLRNSGCDIIYHPGIEILHLKAPMGGFRKKVILEWEKGLPYPKPSPTLMALALKYYSPQQIRGFKTSLFLKYYKKQSIKNPISYIHHMNDRWKKSEIWARELLKGSPEYTLKKNSNPEL